MQAWSRADGPGHVLRPTLAGHHLRFVGVAPSTPSVRAQVAATANGACARTPGHLPRHPRGMPRRGTSSSDASGRWRCPPARAPFAVAPMRAGHSGIVDAAAHCRLRRSPASVSRRTGAPPPCRGDGRLTVRGRAPCGREFERAMTAGSCLWPVSFSYRRSASRLGWGVTRPASSGRSVL